MAYRFRRKETVATGFRRIVREQTAAIISLLADRGNDLENRVHDARRRIKRLRALLHLVRRQLSEPIFTAQNRALRNAARRLASVRDAEVSLSVFEEIRTKRSMDIPQFRESLRKEVARAHRSTITPARLAAIAVGLRKTGHFIAEVSFPNDGWKLIGPGLLRSLRAVQKCHREVQRNHAPAALHEWRKRVKYLALQLELLRRALPKEQRKIACALDKLSGFLGHHRDLFVLRGRLQEYTKTGNAPECAPFDQELERLQNRLLKRIRKLAKQSLSFRVKRFHAAVHRAWKAWHTPPR
jgi:CHAD domain-containing protein